MDSIKWHIVAFVEAFTDVVLLVGCMVCVVVVIAV